MDFDDEHILYKKSAREVMYAALGVLPNFYPDAYYLHLYDGKDFGREDPTPWDELSPSQRQSRRRHYLNPELPALDTVSDEDYPTLIERYRAAKTTPRQALIELQAAKDACKRFSGVNYSQSERFFSLGEYEQENFIATINALYVATCNAYQVLSDAERVNSGVYGCSVFTPARHNKDERVNARRTLNNYLALPLEERAEQNERLRKKSAKTADALWEAMPKLEQLLACCVKDAVIERPLSDKIVERLPPQLVGALPPAGRYPVVLKEKELSETRAAIKPEGLPTDRYILDDGKIQAHGLEGAKRFEILIEAKMALLYIMTLEQITAEQSVRIPTRILSDSLADALGYMHWGYDNSFRLEYGYVRKSPYLEAGPLRDTLQSFITKEREMLGTKRKGETHREYFARFEEEARIQAPALAPLLEEELSRHSRIHTLASEREARTK